MQTIIPPFRALGRIGVALLIAMGLAAASLVSGAAPAHAEAYSNLTVSSISAGENTTPVTVTFKLDTDITAGQSLWVGFTGATFGTGFTTPCITVNNPVDGCPGLTVDWGESVVNGSAYIDYMTWSPATDPWGGATLLVKDIDKPKPVIPAGQTVTFAFAPKMLNFSATGGKVLFETGSITAELPYQIAAPAKTVTFHPLGGTGTMNPQQSSSAAVLNAPAFTRAGYGFTGWNTDAAGTGKAYAMDATYDFTSDVTLYAQWRKLPATPVSTVDIQVPIGQSIANAPVALDVDGLKDQSGYTVTVHSTPQVIDQGVIWSGRLNKAVTLPANLEAGWHRIVIEGTAADGTSFAEEHFFKVSASGTLLEVAESAPSASGESAVMAATVLANTGTEANMLAFSGLGALLLGSLAFAAKAGLRRRGR